MITQGLITLLLKIITPILSLLPDISIPSLNSVGAGYEMFVSYVRMALYFIPLSTVSTIFEIIILFMIVRCVVSFLKTLWAIIPIV